MENIYVANTHSYSFHVVYLYLEYILWPLIYIFYVFFALL